MKNLIFLLSIVLFTNFSYSQTIHHNIEVEVNIQSNTIDVVDNMKLPQDLVNNSEEVIFYLNNNLKLKSLDKQFEIVKFDTEDVDSSRAFALSKYSIKFPVTDAEFVIIPIQYKGLLLDAELRYDVLVENLIITDIWMI